MWILSMINSVIIGKIIKDKENWFYLHEKLIFNLNLIAGQLKIVKDYYNIHLFY